MAEEIGRADVELRADQTGLVKDLGDAQRKVQASGTAMEKSALSTGTAFKAGAAVAAVGFGLMAKGSQDMERSQGAFQAATGKSREEAVAFSKDMNGIVGTSATVGMSFEKLSDTGVEVARQFGLTGKAGQDATLQFSAFAKVTGGDAVEAVQSMDATLDSFHLPAEKATDLMDQLVASNQKYGTEVGPQTVEMLGKMAPALQAMGASMDDGVALLNMFEDSGLDAAGAMRGLNTAVKNLPPGTTLSDYLQKLQDMKNKGIDPTQDAIDIFGAKAGVGIANALQPGGNALEAYKISAQDAEGATDKASEAMVTTGDRIKMMAEKAGAALRGMGQDFGPLLSGAGGLVSVFGALPGKVTGPLVDGMKAVWAKLIPGAVIGGTAVGTAEGEAAAAAAGGPGVLAKFKASGSAAGLAYGLGIAAGVTIGVLAVNEGLNKVQDAANTLQAELDKADDATVRQAAQTEVIFGQTLGQMTDHVANFLGIVAPWHGAFQDVSEATDTLNGRMTAAQKAADDTRESASLLSAELRYKLAPAATEAGEQIGTGLTASAANLDFGKMMGDIKSRLDVAVKNAGFQAIGAAVPGDIANGMIDKSREVLDAGDRLIQLLKEGLSPAEQAAKLMGEKYTKAVAQGIRSNIPGAKEAAQQMAVEAIGTIESAANGAPGQKGLKAIGQYYDSLLASGMDNHAIAVALSAQGVADDVITKLTGEYPTFTSTGKTWSNKIATGVDNGAPAIDTAADNATDPLRNPGPVGQWGIHVADAWKDALLRSLGQQGFKSNVNRTVKWALGALEGQSPPKEGPLRQIDKWGWNVGSAWAEGVKGGVSTASDALVGFGAPRLGGSATMGGAAFGGGLQVNVGGITVQVSGSSASAEDIGSAVEQHVVAAISRVANAAAQRPLSVSGRPV